MDIVIISFLCLSILLYFLLGGADFGAGIIELFTSTKNRSRTRKTMYHAIGPVWEANHMWLIIAIVILFVAFPKVYSVMSVHLHIPLVIMLIGIIARGTAFVFRHYDAVKDDMQWLYNRIFRYSSFVTALFLGIIAGSVISGKIDTQAHTFVQAYVDGWFNAFSIAVGFFTASLCGFLAAIYLIGECKTEEDKKRYIKKAAYMNVAAVGFGLVVFVISIIDGMPLLNWVFYNWVGLTAVILASLSLVLLWYLLVKGKTKILRVLAGFQVTMILIAISYAHFPNFIRLKDGSAISLYESIGPEKTVYTLGMALLLGSVLILPFLGYLFYKFQQKEE
jgi:cytochrome d ubiquinol oxidase subunit II